MSAVPISLGTTQEHVVPNGSGGCTNHQAQKEMLPPVAISQANAIKTMVSGHFELTRPVGL